MDKKYDPSNLFLKGHIYNEWYKKDEKKKNASQLENTISARKKQLMKIYLTCHHYKVLKK